jgi:hypothetical protein
MFLTEGGCHPAVRSICYGGLRKPVELRFRISFDGKYKAGLSKPECVMLFTCNINGHED